MAEALISSMKCLHRRHIYDPAPDRNLVNLCLRAGLTQANASRLLTVTAVRTYWIEPETRLRQSTFERQRAMCELVQALHAAGIKDIQIGSFCGLSDRIVQLLLAKKL
ncbi:hypothetical protein IOC47_22870 [Enterobacter cloacae]|uniref:hypothetical protein n=1 Tax=Enterobacteriaceae TaxID=543 RepID=UPI000598DA06|nr:MULTISPECIES: hypothetical protein [Enterobacteriaceae]HBM7601045.1 hypothetical protein [Enterobacter asburiae]HBR1984273.1 hypothetical protein [Klebsiella quasipneumoniae subsp. quasipneumoniae]HCI6708512.1 hypothetical protein [Klebsiella quasipneumoniae subsp. similipneumoniae]ELS4527926.1 hypothetical protein [Enterobacter hormaechei]KII59395.1 hypothetical protein SE21_04480 [Klebsiella quasipneumoniae]